MPTNNKTRKATTDISMPVLQKLVKKYNVTKSGSKKDVAMRLRQVRPHMMTLSELNMIEDFLKLPPRKRYIPKWLATLESRVRSAAQT